MVDRLTRWLLLAGLYARLAYCDCQIALVELRLFLLRCAHAWLTRSEQERDNDT